MAAPTFGAVVVYEGGSFPEDVGWERLAGGDPERSLEDGWLVQSFPESSQESYRYNISEPDNSIVDRFFVEWRAIADYPAGLIDDWQVPTVVSAAGRAGVLYHTVMTESAAVLLRDVLIPRVIAPISVAEPHTYRVEVHADAYAWYIDGGMVDKGIPEGPYPDSEAFVIWGARQNDIKSATIAWDFVRFGRIPDDASGDYDSDAVVGLFDYYFVHDCLTKDGPGIFAGPQQNAGPGCRFTDFDADTDTDLLDFAEFANQFTGSLP